MPISKNRRKKGKSRARKNLKRSTSVRSGEQEDNPLALLQDLGAMLQQLSADLADAAVEDYDDPLRQAQELVYEAWEARLKRDRIRLAKKALGVSPLCVDAYVLLAEEAARTIVEARRYYAQGVAAGETVLGPAVFKDDVGHFWGLHETRPYMRARAGLAECLWQLGERADAVEHLRDMLRLNPNDNQGLRSVLASWLLAQDDLAAAENLLAAYKEEGFAQWAYDKALLTFRQKGPSGVATRALRKALDNNPHVADLLLGARSLPRKMPPAYGLGSPEEAFFYVERSAENWSAVPGALQWLAEVGHYESVMFDWNAAPPPRIASAANG